MWCGVRVICRSFKAIDDKEATNDKKAFDDMIGACREETVGDRTFKKAKALRGGK